MRELKRAKELAEEYLLGLFPQAWGVLLEEVEPGDGEHRWLITLSYLPPERTDLMDVMKDIVDPSPLRKAQKELDRLETSYGRGHDIRSGRIYKRFDVDVEKDVVLSMTIREIGLV